ncbi:nucleic-acid-binding protein from transposon X-element [Nephila pilipes]|uniref:Nucleic-acid-binding protein from transposon X-element n=1 Tax=Nephila pilipes TaxID=299642 RepID=A0A8X6PKN3_NEPPI|nr:nucleic-acid-binding protein from transposon X-element [Nephila pilipes]
MHFFPTSSGVESEIDTVANKTIPVTTPANLDQNPTRDTESDYNDRFNVVNRKKKKVPPIVIDESMNTTELLKELSEKIGTKLLGRFVNGNLKVFPETPNQHRIIQNYISVKKLKSRTFEMTHQKSLKVLVRGLPADYDTNEIINELKYFGFNLDHVSVLKNKKITQICHFSCFF